MASQMKGKARGEGKGKKTAFVAGVELLDDARIAAYEKYRETDAYQGMDDKMRVLMVAFLAALATIWGLFLWLDSVLLPGARFVPIALVLYGAGSILRLWIICNWMVWRSSIKGLEFMPRCAPFFALRLLTDVAKLILPKFSDADPCSTLRSFPIASRLFSSGNLILNTPIGQPVSERSMPVSSEV